jgi:hypothetical protein
MRVILNVSTPIELRDHSETPYDPPGSYLFGQTVINGCPFNVEGIQVKQDTEAAQSAVAESYGARMAAMTGAHERTFTTIHIHGREYVILITPHLRGDTL